MSLFEDTNPRDLKELLAQIHSREAALPDFQRDFVWDPNATQELIVSIAANYPAGSLLRIRNTHHLFASREFQGAPALDGHQPTYLILDGQQRQTSLYQAFYGVGEHRYYLNIRKLLDGLDFEEAVFHLRSTAKKAREYEQEAIQIRDLILPFSVLYDRNGGFVKWSRMVCRQQPATDRDALEDTLQAIESRWIRTIEHYRFPVVTLSDQTSAEAVCTIFETLNRTGVKLSPFELLTARFWPKNVNLRQLWQHACATYPLIHDFDIDPYYVLQVVALLARNTPSCKRGDVLSLAPTAINEWWEHAITGLARGLKMLRDDCGVIQPHWLPYNTIVIPLAALFAVVEKTTGPARAAHLEKIQRWFWCSVFGQAYENSPNSQAAKDVIEMRAWFDGHAAPETIRAFHFDPAVLRDTTPRQRAVYRGVMALVMQRGSRDFHTGTRLTTDSIIEHHVDDHHIFPASYLDRHGIAARLRDCILNRTLIDRKTNMSISNRAPSQYMHDIRSALGHESFVNLLQSHLIPSDHNAPIWTDTFDTFLDQRQAAIGQEIHRVTQGT